MELLFIGYTGHDADLIKKAFESDGRKCAINFSVNLSEAGKAVQAREYDLYIAEYRLPDGKGIDFLNDGSGSVRPLIITFNELIDDGESASPALDFVKKTDSSLRAMPGIVMRALHKWALSRDNVQLHQEILDRKWMEDTLKRINEKFKNLVANIPGVVFQRAFDRNWTMYFISNEAEKITGYKPSDFVKDYNVVYSNIIHPNDFDMVSETISSNISLKKPYSVEYRILHSEGSIRWVNEMGQGIYDDDGHIQWIDGSIFDITDRIQAGRELSIAKDAAESATRSKTEFLARMSHEIRTPLNIISGFAELALEPGTDYLKNDYIKSIKESADYMLMIINEILDFSKIEAGEIVIEPVNFDLRSLVESLVKNFSIMAGKKGIFIDLKYHEGLGTRFSGDETRIKQILMNLLGNAVKFTESGGVTLSAEPYHNEDGFSPGSPGGWPILFTVHDSGMGVPQEDIKIIFEKYKHAARRGKKDFRGTGLGLAICRKLVELMDGNIWVESSLSKGSSFKFTLKLGPWKDSDVISSPETGFTEAEKRVPLRILVAEDNPVNIKLMTRLLEKIGDMPETALNGREVIDMLQKKTYGLVIMDMEMPVMNGIEAAGMIRKGAAGEDNSTIPILMITGFVHPEAARLCSEVGIDGYLIKPVSIKILTSAIHRLKDRLANRHTCDDLSDTGAVHE